MARKVDKDVLIGFVEEANSYLPAIFAGISTFYADPAKIDTIEEAYRFTHTIKGASSMVGLAELSHIANYVEEILEEWGTGQLIPNDRAVAFLHSTLNHIDDYLDGIVDDILSQPAVMAEVMRDYQRLRGLPVTEELVADAATNPKQESQEALMAELVSSFADFDDDGLDDDFDDLESILDIEDMSAELLESFIIEAEDHLRIVSTALASLDKDPEQKDLLQSVRRSIHTLKGAAGTVGFPTISELSHRMEDLLDLLYEGDLVCTPEMMDLMFRSSDALQDLLTGENADELAQTVLPELYAQYTNWLNSDDVGRAEAINQSPPLEAEAVINLADLAPKLSKAETAVTPPKPAEPAPASEMVRVSLDRLDELVRLVSELVITRTTFEQRMGNLVRIADELHPSIDRLRRVSTKLETQYEVTALDGGQWTLLDKPPLIDRNGGSGGTVVGDSTLSNSEFDALEFDRYTEFHLLTRELTEATSDIRTVGNELGHLIGDFDSILNRQGRLSSEIQDKMMRTRMVPLATLATRLHRAVRVVARKQGKLADLLIDGEQVELDKAVLEKIADPLLHVLRNAVDHGIEPTALRQVMGKPERGSIQLRAYYQGNQVILEIKDDGAGLDPHKLRTKAINAGYLSEADAAKMSDQELYALIFVPGFSTAEEVSDISGRGVGLDVLKTNVQKLKGTVTVDSTSDAGTTFKIWLPMTLAITRALIIKAHHESFAIPLAAVSQILRLERNEIDYVGQEPVVHIGGKVYPLMRLGELLKLRQPADETSSRISILIVEAGTNQIALVVDEIVEGREIVLKSLGNHLRRIHGVTGATLMGDGSVVLILNPADLITEPTGESQQIWSAAPRLEIAQRKALSIMIVDDSVSVRRVMSNLIRNVGWDPIVARDGLDALELIESAVQSPDLILLDVEMPRMDGYELAATLKAHDVHKHIPIVMVTSRAGSKHRSKAMSLGVSEYVVKPYQDDHLLGIIRRLTGEMVGSR